MEQVLIISGRFPSYNEVTQTNRGKQGIYLGNKLKRKWTEIVAWECKGQKIRPFTKQIDIDFLWVCKDKRRDKDNIMSAQKFIFDGLQAAGVIKNDGWNEIREIKHKFIKSAKEKVIVRMEEVEKC